MQKDAPKPTESKEAPFTTPTEDKPSGIERKPKKKGSCLKSCLVFFVVLALLIGALVAMVLGLPRKLGLIPSKAEKAFVVDEPDHVAAASLRADIEKEGLSTKGMDIYVLPYKEGNHSAAYVVLDEGAGFSFAPSAGGEPFLDTLAALAKSEAAKANGVTHVAFEYKDKQGRTLVVMGSNVQAGADFANKKITREEFMAQVGGQADLKNISDVTLEQLK